MSQDESRSLPTVVDRSTFQEQLEALRVREKAHTREGDAIAAGRRRLPVVEVAADSPLLGPRGPVTLLDAFEGRRQLIAYYFMWWPGRPAAEQCEGCTWVMSHVGEFAYLHSRDITFACFARGGTPPMALAMRRRHTTRASATAPSWAGTCRGTRPSPHLTRSSSTASTVYSTWCATCATATGSSRRTGPTVVVPRCWTTATRSWTSPCSAGRRTGRTHLWAGRGADTQLGPWAGPQSGRPSGSGQAVAQPRSGHGSKPGIRTIWERRTRVLRLLRITATEGSCAVTESVP